MALFYFQIQFQLLRGWGFGTNLLAQGALPVKEAQITFEKKVLNRINFQNQNELPHTISRKILEETLLARVKKEGGEIKFGSRITELEELKNSGDCLVLAHGRKTQPQKNGWYGWNAQFENVNQPDGALSMHFYRDGYIGVQTYQNGKSNVSGIVYRSQHSKLNWESIFEHAKSKNIHFAKLIKEAKRNSAWQGVGPMIFSKKMHKMNGTILAGDAAAVGDPFMGEGIGRALSAGPMISQAISKSLKEDFSIEYNTLWKKAFEKKLTRGSWIRILLRMPSDLSAPVRILFKSNFFMRKNLSIFHKGAPLNDRTNTRTLIHHS